MHDFILKYTEGHKNAECKHVRDVKSDCALSDNFLFVSKEKKHRCLCSGVANGQFLMPYFLGIH